MESVSGLNSMNDGLHYSAQEESDALGSIIVKYSYESGNKVAEIASSKTIFGNSDKRFDGYSFSSDEKFLLLQTETEPIYRHSFSAN